MEKVFGHWGWGGGKLFWGGEMWGKLGEKNKKGIDDSSGQSLHARKKKERVIIVKGGDTRKILEKNR